jgi:transketolase
MNPAKGIETSSGSLGMGLSLGIGVALAGKKAQKDYSVYVLMGDGECGEGAVWEAAMSAAHYGLDNLIAIVDRNELQYDGFTREIMDLGDFGAKWRSFGWEVAEIDGHSVREIFDALYPRPRILDTPYVVIAHTIKGKGVSFMENNREWHHGRLSKSQYAAAVAEQDAKPLGKT